MSLRGASTGDASESVLSTPKVGVVPEMVADFASILFTLVSGSVCAHTTVALVPSAEMATSGALASPAPSAGELTSTGVPQVAVFPEIVATAAAMVRTLFSDGYTHTAMAFVPSLERPSAGESAPMATGTLGRAKTCPPPCDASPGATDTGSLHLRSPSTFWADADCSKPPLSGEEIHSAVTLVPSLEVLIRSTCGVIGEIDEMLPIEAD